MANKAECFEFIYYVVINKMADDVNLITCSREAMARSIQCKSKYQSEFMK